MSIVSVASYLASERRQHRAHARAYELKYGHVCNTFKSHSQGKEVIWLCVKPRCKKARVTEPCAKPKPSDGGI